MAQGPDVARWVDGIAAAFEHAAARERTVERRAEIAGAPVRLRFAGARLAERLAPALGHAGSAAAGPPELTVAIWDSPSGAGAEPPLPETDPNEPRGAVFYASDGDRQVAYQPGLSLLSAYDGSTGCAWYWCRSASSLPFWEPAAPFRQILHWWLADRGLLLLHGAAVGRPDGGALIVGRGGSGKSTCALSCLASDLLYAGDDYVAVDAGDNPYVHSLYSTGKLQPDHAKLLPHLPYPTFAGDAALDEKAVFNVRERFAERLCAGFPLRAVLVPRVTGPELRSFPVSPAAALRGLAPSTLLQLRPARPEALAAMARLVQRLPAFGIDVAGATDRIPPLIGELLSTPAVRSGQVVGAGASA